LQADREETEKWGKVVKFAGIKPDDPSNPEPTFHKSDIGIADPVPVGTRK